MRELLLFSHKYFNYIRVKYLKSPDSKCISNIGTYYYVEFIKQIEKLLFHSVEVSNSLRKECCCTYAPTLYFSHFRSSNSR